LIKILTLFSTINFITPHQMNHQKGVITRSATNKRLRDEMIFWKEMDEVHEEARIVSVCSYMLEICSYYPVELQDILNFMEENRLRKEFNPNNVLRELESNLIKKSEPNFSGFLVPR
jgi:hypothetical protein